MFHRLCFLITTTAAAAAVLVCTPANLFAQFTQASIVGAVTDGTGAPAANALVTLRNEGTNLSRTIRTEEGGDYRFSGLEVGFYQITVAMAGFKTFEQTQIDVVSGQSKRVDVQLEVGEVNTRITVEGGLTQIDTESATLSNLKTARDFAELPLSVFGRGWANITNVTAGVQSASGFEVNGARYGQQLYGGWHFRQRHDQQPQHGERVLRGYRNVSGDPDTNFKLIRGIRTGRAVLRGQ